MKNKLNNLKALRQDLLDTYFSMVQKFGFGDIPEEISNAATKVFDHSEKVRAKIEDIEGKVRQVKIKSNAHVRVRRERLN